MMNFFNHNVPIVTPKQSAFAAPKMPGVWRLHWQVNHHILFSSFYTPHDQACLLWGSISAVVFAMAQFLPLDWGIQTGIATLLTGLGVIAMIRLTWQFVWLERLGWVLGWWVGLMLLGAIATYEGIWGGWTWVLLHICPLWLCLSGLGYGITGLGLRSRLFLILGIAHAVMLPVLDLFPAWKPLLTGIVISGSAFLIAEFQWDANGVCGYQLQAETDSANGVTGEWMSESALR